MQLLQATLKAGTSQMEPGAASAIVFNQLFNRLGDNNARIREKAEEILLQMAGHPSFGAQYPPGKHNINFQSCLEYALHGFQHQNGDIRNQAYHVILEIYKSVGTKVRQNLTGLRQAQQEMLENAFCEIDGVDPSSAKARGSPPKDSLAAPNNKLGALGGSKPNS